MTALQEASSTTVADAEAPSQATAARSLRLAYLVNQYPKVSHTFIRREILELERIGFSILRLSIRDTRDEVADQVDRVEADKTFVCLEQGIARFAVALLAAMTRPVRLIQAMRIAVGMGRESSRGVARHLAYLLEACVLLGLVRRHRIDHVHVHFGTNAAAVARLMRRLGGPTYSMTIHGPTEFDAPVDYRLEETVSDAAFVVAISSYCSAQVRRWAPFDCWGRIHIVHCAVDDSFLAEPTAIDSGSATFVSVGRLSQQKGQLLLVEAMARLLEEGVEADLVLVGDGEMRAQIESRIDALELGGHVAITGWMDGAGIRKQLEHCRAFVLPSFAEGLPVVIMEALARARPVIATTINGIPELVEDGVNGWLVPAGSIEALVDALRAATETSVERLEEMGRSGRERVAREFAAEVEAGKLASLFHRYVA